MLGLLGILLEARAAQSNLKRAKKTLEANREQLRATPN
jgi:hypothetical protein